MDTKLKADIAESAVITELLKRGFKVLKPIGDRLPYDLGVDLNGRLIRLQVKSAWFDKPSNTYVVDARRTKTNRRRMLRQRYDSSDFDCAVLYIDDLHVFYVMPVSVFTSFSSSITLVEADKRQRKPKSTEYKDRWDLLSEWAPQSETIERTSVKLGETLTGNTEPSRMVKAGKLGPVDQGKLLRQY